MSEDALTRAALAVWQEPAHRPAPSPERQRRAAARQWLEPHRVDELYAVNELAAQWFEQHYQGSWAQDYLQSRTHVDLAGDRGARPGCAPHQWRGLVEHLAEQGVSEDTMLEVGVAFRARSGRVVDLMRDRLVLPVHDDTGRIAGFVGRENPDNPGTAKYINTKRTALFDKGELFCSAMPVRGRVAIVEGPADALAVTVGSDGAVVGAGTLGTALTQGHAERVAELGHEPIVWRDDDEPGWEAAERDFRLLAQYRVEPLMTVAAEGMDPADVLTQHGPSGIQTLIEQARPAGDVLIEHHLRAGRVTEAVSVAAEREPCYWSPDAARIASTTGHEPAAIRDALAAVVNGATTTEFTNAAADQSTPMNTNLAMTTPEVSGQGSSPGMEAVQAASAGRASVREQLETVAAQQQRAGVVERSPSVAAQPARHTAVLSSGNERGR